MAMKLAPMARRRVALEIIRVSLLRETDRLVAGFDTSGLYGTAKQG
jgi:hypothetical protein